MSMSESSEKSVRKRLHEKREESRKKGDKKNRNKGKSIFDYYSNHDNYFRGQIRPKQIFKQKIQIKK